MLKKDSEKIYSELVAMNATLAVDGFFTDFFPIVADNEVQEPYCNYTLAQTSISSKDGMREYNLTLTVVAKNYDDMAEGTDHLQEYFNKKGGFKFSGSNPRYVDNLDRAVIDTTYNFKNQ
jgi:hypothetical protein